MTNLLNTCIKLTPKLRNALLAASYEWARSMFILKTTPWTTEDALITMAGRPVENRGQLSVRMPRGFPANVEPPPKSAADLERSELIATWLETIKDEFDGHKT